MALGRETGAAMAAGVLSYFTRHRTAANLLLVVMIALGIAAAPRMRAQFFPDVIVDTVTVSVEWEGSGAEDVDAGIVQVLEPVLLGVEGGRIQHRHGARGQRLDHAGFRARLGHGPRRRRSAGRR